MLKENIRLKRKLYTGLYLIFCLTLSLTFFAGCGSGISEKTGNPKETENIKDAEGSENSKDMGNSEDTGNSSDRENEGLKLVRSVDFQYAKEVTIDFYEDDYVHIHVGDGNDYVMIPQGGEDRDLGFSGASLIHADPGKIYQASSSVMDLLIQLDELDRVSFCSTTSDDYSIDAVKERIEDGIITYVGKYSAPDYEILLDGECDLAIENTMIYHSPKIKEQLEEIGIPVFVERSSYETEPLGRLEWIKVYGVLLGKEEEANAYFDEQSAKIKAVTDSISADEKADGGSKKTVAVFYISSSGYVNVRKPGDYLVKMIETAGGSYALSDVLVEEENALSTINIDFEDFYREAVDADILIYNGTIDKGVKKASDLLEKNELFSDFKAVKDGQVYCTGLNMFQESSKIAEITEDFYHIIKDDGVETKYVFHLE